MQGIPIIATNLGKEFSKGRGSGKGGKVRESSDIPMPKKKGKKLKRKNIVSYLANTGWSVEKGKREGKGERSLAPKEWEEERQEPLATSGLGDHRRLAAVGGKRRATRK